MEPCGGVVQHPPAIAGDFAERAADHINGERFDLHQ
jgi:hypothetical protein